MKRVLLAGLALASIFFPTSAIVSLGQVRDAAISPDSPWVITNSTAQSLPFSQNWANTSLITTSDDWNGVPGIIGYRGDALAIASGADPQTITADGSATPVDVNANRNDPSVFG